MCSNPLVSVIMACYNEEIIWLKKSIDSILNQTYNHFEFIIVCDNPNNIEINELLNEYKKSDSRIKVYINEKNLGLVKSLNRALKECSGELIARMDADDISIDCRLEKQVNYFKENLNVDFLMSKIEYIDEEDNILKRNRKINFNKLEQTLKYCNMSIHPTWMFKKQILKKVNEYNEISFAEDYDFLCRVILSGFQVRGMEEKLLLYRLRSNGVTKSKRANQEINAQIIAENYKNAISKGRKYDALSDVNLLTEHEISNFIEIDANFKGLKKEFSQKKISNGYKLLKIFIKSNIKRKQVFNYGMFKLINYR